MISRTTISAILLTVILVLELLFFHLSDEIKFPLMLTVLLFIAIFLFLQKPLFLPKIFTFLFPWLLFAYVVSGLTSSISFQTTLEIIKLLCFFILTILTVNLFKEDKKLFFQVFFILSFTAAFLALVGILEFTGRLAAQKNLPLIEPFHWPNLSASFFLLVLPVTFLLFLNLKVNFKKIILFITLALLSIALILTKSYTMLLLSILLTLSLFHFYSLIKNKDFFRLKINIRDVALFILLLLILLPNLFSSFGGNPIPPEINLHLDHFFFQDKADIIGFSLQSIKNHFLTGIGVGNFGSVYQANLMKPWTWSNFAESELLQTFVETGFLGFTAFLLIFIYLIIIAVKQLYMSIKKENLLEISIFLTIITFLLLTSNNSSLRIFPIAIVFYFLLGYLLSFQESIRIEHKSIFLLFGSFLIFSITVFTDGILLNLGQRLFVQENYNPSKTIFSWVSRRPKFLLNPKVLIWSAALQNEEGNLDEALKYLYQAKKNYYYNQDIDYQIAFFHYNKGEKEVASKILEENILAHPYVSPKYYLALAKIEAEENKLALNLYWLGRASLIFPINKQKEFSPLMLSILDSKDYLNSLRSIYYSLYETTNNKQYLHSFADLIY